MTSVSPLRYTPASVGMLWFDLDDTLWDMTGNSVLCLREIYDRFQLGRYFSGPAEWDEIYHRINAALWERYSAGEISRAFLRSERFAAPLRLVGVAPAEAEKMSADLDVSYLSLLGAQSGLIDGASEILQWLRARGYRMGIVSNGFREVQYNKLRSSSIDTFFDEVVLSDDAGYNKPDRRFFAYAESRAGSGRGLNVIVGDNPVTDIRGALEAGWDAVWFDPERSGACILQDGCPGRFAGTVAVLEGLKQLF